MVIKSFYLGNINKIKQSALNEIYEINGISY